MAMDPLSGTGHRDPRNAATGAGEALGLRSGAVVVLRAEGAEGAGFWRLSSGGRSLLARAEGPLVPGAAYRVLAERGSEGGLGFRVLGSAGRSGAGEVPGGRGGAAETAAFASKRAGSMPGGARPPAQEAALLALVREGLSLSRLPQLGRLAARSRDADEAAGLLARALAEDPGTSEADLERLLDRVFGASGSEDGQADPGDQEEAEAGRDGTREGSAGRGQAGLVDEGLVEADGLARFLAARALGGVDARTARGRWAYHSFAFELDGVALSGVMRILVPERPGGAGAIAASLRAGVRGQPWRFRLDFGEGRAPQLLLGRGVPSDRVLARAVAAVVEDLGLATYRLLEPGEDPDGASLPPELDGHA